MAVITPCGNDQRLRTTDDVTHDLLTLTTGVSLPTSGGTPVTLDWYSTGTHNTNWTGIWNATTVAGNIEWVRVGNMVTLYLPDVTATSHSSVSALTNVTALPEYLQPISTTRSPLMRVNSGGSRSVGVASVATNGTITISYTLNGGTFPISTATSGIANSLITYIL
jgi:hypothetical protein